MAKANVNKKMQLHKRMTNENVAGNGMYKRHAYGSAERY